MFPPSTRLGAMEKRKGKIKNAHAVSRIRKRERERDVSNPFSHVVIYRFSVGR